MDKLEPIKLAQLNLLESVLPNWRIQYKTDWDRSGFTDGYLLVTPPSKTVYGKVFFEPNGNVKVILDHPAYQYNRPMMATHIGDPNLNQKIFDFVSEIEK